MASFLALTSHWISLDKATGRLTLKSALIGFHRIKTRHTGTNIAKTILYLLDRANVTLKVCFDFMFLLYLFVHVFAFPQIGHFTLDNAENNAVAMRELESLLAARETATAIGFDRLNHRVRCYAHIINICSSHIIASVTSIPESYISDLKVGSNIANYDSDSDSSDGEPDIEDLDLDGCYDNSSPQFDNWLAGIKRDPLRRARRIVRLLRSSDQRREGFRAFVQDGNERGWFTAKDDKGRRTPVQVPELQPLRDVKTRWDSVYMMLQRLRELRPVRLSRLVDQLQRYILLMSTQAIDMYFDVELADFSCHKLSDLDWEILEGLEAVLMVSRLHKPRQALITFAGSSHFSAKSVVRVNANLVACNCHF